MVDYPVDFKAKAKGSSRESGWEVSTSEGLETEMTTPEEFGGDSENPSPEDLFTASLTSCILATFKITAERKNLEYEKIEVECDASLERDDKEGRPVMKEAKVDILVEKVSDKELAREVGQISDKNCFIHNSVKTDVETSFEFTE